MVYRLHKEMNEGKVVGLSLGVAEVDAYLEFIRHLCRPHTWVNCGYDLQVFLNTVAKPVLEVKPKDILGFIQRQRETPPFVGPEGGQQGWGLASLNPGLSPNTIRRRLATISGFYEFLRIRGDLDRASPVPRALPTRRQFWFGEPRGRPGSANRALVRSPRTLPQPLETEDVNQFLDSLRTFRDKAIVLLMLLAGLRKSEVLGLALPDINFAKHTVMVRDGKGGHDRLVPVSSAALEATLRYLNEERPASSTDKVFLVLKGPHKGLPLTRDGFQMVVRHHRRRAGTPQVQCHRLRHTCLTHLRQAGMSLEALQAQAGHQSIMSTRVYLHLCAQELQDEYLRVSEKLFLPPEESDDQPRG